MSLRLVPCSAPGVRVATTGPITHRCPHVDETDEGEITITWVTGAWAMTIELHSLADYLAGFKDQRISHEDLALAVADELASCGVTRATVAARFATAGLAVEVSRAVPGDAIVQAGT